MMDLLPSHAPRWLRHLSLTPYANANHFWLVVVCKIIDWRPSKAKVYYNFVFFHRSNCRPNWSKNIPPHAPHQPRLLSNIPPTVAVAPIWLLLFPSKFQPPKAKAPFPLFFFDASSFRLPNRQTSHCAAKLDHGCLSWDHRDPRCHWLGAPIACPWREMAKPVEGRVAAAHFGCCVLCVVCCGYDKF